MKKMRHTAQNVSHFHHDFHACSSTHLVQHHNQFSGLSTANTSRGPSLHVYAASPTEKAVAKYLSLPPLARAVTHSACPPAAAAAGQRARAALLPLPCVGPVVELNMFKVRAVFDRHGRLSFSVSNMRALTEEEMKAFFEKLANFIGPSIKDMLDRSDQPHVFRLHKDRVWAIICWC
jgi:hypothetical protein